MDWPSKQLIGPRPQVTLDERMIFIGCLIVWSAAEMVSLTSSLWRKVEKRLHQQLTGMFVCCCQMFR